MSVLCYDAMIARTRTHRHDEMGTPFRVIADQSTLESGTVLLQDRDTTIEVNINTRSS